MKRNQIVDAIIDSGLIESGTAVIVGLSGGPDSLCLVHALAGISDMYDIRLFPVHINHQLRAEAEDEADNVDRICERLDLECRFFDAPCKEIAEEMGVSTEEAGRSIRYQIFDEVASELEESGIPADRIHIALGHNADDQAETVLFRLIRGTGPHGLTGIPPARMSEGGYLIVRPLLSVERKDIEKYIKENRLRPNIDRSNSENDYSRNKIRNELIPYIEREYNAGIKEHLRRYAALAHEDDWLLRNYALDEYNENITVDEENVRAILDVSGIKDNPIAVNSRIVGLVMDLLGLEQHTTYEIVTGVMGLIYSDKASGGIDLPMGIRAQREYDRLIFSAGIEDLKADTSLEICPRVITKGDFEPDTDSPYAAFDFDKFEAEFPGRLGDITLRTRCEGDYLPIKNGSKKIQDLLVDSKVRKAARGSILMVCIGSEVLWILPSNEFAGEAEQSKGRFSPKFHIDETTKRVLLIELTDSL